MLKIVVTLMNPIGQNLSLVDRALDKREALVAKRARVKRTVDKSRMIFHKITTSTRNIAVKR